MYVLYEIVLNDYAEEMKNASLICALYNLD